MVCSKESCAFLLCSCDNTLWKFGALIFSLLETGRKREVSSGCIQKWLPESAPGRGTERTLQSANSARARPPNVFPCELRPAARSAILSQPAIADVQATSATRSVFPPFTDAVIALTWSGVGLGEATKEAPLGSTSRQASRICFSASPLSGSGV